MALDDFRRAVPGSPLSARSLNRALAQVEQLSRLAAPNLLRIGGGIQVVPTPDERSVIAKVTGVGTNGAGNVAYAWTEQERTPDGSAAARAGGGGLWLTGRESQPNACPRGGYHQPREDP